MFGHKVPLQTPPNVAEKYACDLAAPTRAGRLKADLHAPKLRDQLRARVRAKHYSIRTEDAYVDWARRFILHFDKRHPRGMGGAEVEQFLSDLAVRGQRLRLDAEPGQVRASVSVPCGARPGTGVAAECHAGTCLLADAICISVAIGSVIQAAGLPRKALVSTASAMMR